MTEHRVEGVVGNTDDPIHVHTEWFDSPRPEVEGMAIGLETMYQWRDVEVVERD